MAIKNQDIKNILKIELLKLCDDLQIMDHRIDWLRRFRANKKRL